MFDEYQVKSSLTAIFPKESALEYLCLGLVSEAGEVAGKIKKIIRDDKSKITEERKNEIASELGDVLWYLAQLSLELNIPLSTIANQNIEKLKDRISRGKISGSGDTR
jgi:NTP pyrophosphatase (non-canonical NTP hydrolase)